MDELKATDITNNPSLLRWLVERCQTNLRSDQRAQEYLRSNGITDETIWATYRLGSGDREIPGQLSIEDKQRCYTLGLLSRKGPSLIVDGGIFLPTCDPREPQNILGVVKWYYRDNTHRFITPPLGLCCPADIGQYARVVIADAPLMGLLLAQAGVTGVVIANGPEVLPPLTDWLKGHEVVIASYKRRRLEAFRQALGPLGERTALAQLQLELWKSSAEALATLGIDRDALRGQPTPALLSKVAEYARARLADGQGVQLLRELGADAPELTQAHGLGYLPLGFLEALATAERRLLTGRILTDALVVPALDAEGNAADLLFVRSPRHRTQVKNLHQPPAGLISPKVATTFDSIVLVDSLATAARRFKAGQRNVLLVRGLVDVTTNAARLKNSGVCVAEVACEEDGEAIVAALKAVGIDASILLVAAVQATEAAVAAEPEPTPAKLQQPIAGTQTRAASVGEVPDSKDRQPTQAADKPTLVKHDAKAELATFSAGDATYQVEVTMDSGTKLQVRLERGGKIALDRFDFAVEAQRRRFAVSAAMRTGIPFEQIEQHLVSILEDVARIQQDLQNPVRKVKATVEITETEKAETLSFLKRPDLLDAIASELESVGWAGEERNKRLLYLCSVSRKLPMPLSAILRSPSGVGKSVSVETIAALTPPEDLLHCSRLTEGSLYYVDQDALRHKLLVIDEADALTPEVLVAIRVLQSRGVLTQTYTHKDPITGATATQFIEAKGPISALMSTTRALDEQALSRCFDLVVDESQDQTRRVLETQRKMRADPDCLGQRGRRAKTINRHQNLQRLLACTPILIPFAARIEFPSASIRHRREQERFLNLIEASALLHQHQRLKQKNASGEEFIIADLRDFEIAASLAAESIARAGDELSANARDVLELAQVLKSSSFDVNDLKALKPEWTRHKVRAGLDELLALDILSSPRRTRPRRYVLHAASIETLSASRVRLRPAAAIGELATIGERGFANTSSTAATA